MRCFSGGIVFVDVLEVLDATLSRFFSLTTERVSFTLHRRNILRLYYSLFADARAERPYIGEYTLSLCIVFGGLLPTVVNSLRRLAKTHTLVVYFCVRSLTVCFGAGSVRVVHTVSGYLDG